ncbi:hypothetical protein, partial [Streptococcus pneumoniae]
MTHYSNTSNPVDFPKSMREQLLDLLYSKKREVYAMSDEPQEEFDCLVALIEDGTIDSFAELAEYGVTK